MTTVVDLFAGIGGLSIGFELAGATCVAAVESNPHHAAAFRGAHRGSARVLEARVDELSARDILTATNLHVGELDVLVGGPPCQPFSTAGKRRGRGDVRGNLVFDFVRYVAELRPRAFVIENVVGMRSIHAGALLDDVMDAIAALGYTSLHYVLDAADFGVPQHRRRLFIVGTRIAGSEIEEPVPTHGDPFKTNLFSYSKRPLVTVKDAIWDLPGARYQKRTRLTDDAVSEPYSVGHINEFQRLMRGSNRSVTGNGVTTHVSHILQAIERKSLAPGEVEPRTRYRRLYWDRPSFTLRAGSGTFTALRPIHPSQSRVITVREAARLQSFPDYVHFSSAKIWAYQQIGNSVPPLLACAVAKSVLSTLAGQRTRT